MPPEPTAQASDAGSLALIQAQPSRVDGPGPGVAVARRVPLRTLYVAMATEDGLAVFELPPTGGELIGVGGDAALLVETVADRMDAVCTDGSAPKNDALGERLAEAARDAIRAGLAVKVMITAPCDTSTVLENAQHVDDEMVAACEGVLVSDGAKEGESCGLHEKPERRVHPPHSLRMTARTDASINAPAYDGIKLLSRYSDDNAGKPAKKPDGSASSPFPCK